MLGAGGAVSLQRFVQRTCDAQCGAGRWINVTTPRGLLDALEKHDRGTRQKTAQVLFSRPPETFRKYLGRMSADVPESGRLQGYLYRRELEIEVRQLDGPLGQMKPPADRRPFLQRAFESLRVTVGPAWRTERTPWVLPGACPEATNRTPANSRNKIGADILGIAWLLESFSQNRQEIEAAKLEF